MWAVQRCSGKVLDRTLEPHPIVGNKVLYIFHGGNCIKLENVNGNLKKSSLDRLQVRHEEAETLIGLHAYYCTGRIVIRSSDTDAIIILLGIMNQMPAAPEIIIYYRTSASRRFINVTEIALKLKEIHSYLPGALPTFHALKGCDYTSSFYRKGKSKPFAIPIKEPRFIETIYARDRQDTIQLTTLTEFICTMYGTEGINNINKLRYSAFMKMR